MQERGESSHGWDSDFAREGMVTAHWILEKFTGLSLNWSKVKEPQLVGRELPVKEAHKTHWPAACGGVLLNLLGSQLEQQLHSQESCQEAADSGGSGCYWTHWEAITGKLLENLLGHPRNFQRLSWGMTFAAGNLSVVGLNSPGVGSDLHWMSCIPAQCHRSKKKQSTGDQEKEPLWLFSSALYWWNLTSCHLAREKCSRITSRQQRVGLELRGNKLKTGTVPNRKQKI